MKKILRHVILTVGIILFCPFWLWALGLVFAAAYANLTHVPAETRLATEDFVDGITFLLIGCTIIGLAMILIAIELFSNDK